MSGPSVDAGTTGWSFSGIPSTDTESEGLKSRIPGSFQDEATASATGRQSNTPYQRQNHDSAAEGNRSDTAGAPAPDAQRRNPNRTYGPRTCRICLEIVQPTFHPPNPSLPSIFQSTGYVTYDSEEAESGRLIRPCKCKGSSRYVHEACLQQWRYADRDFGARNYWVCPTCGFQYRVQRVDWARWINNVFTQLALTLMVFLVAMFVLGFIADPIINLYVDPYNTITTGDFGRDVLDDEERYGWFAHFMKGLASLGLLGFLKVILVSPWQWWNLRQSGLLGGRRAGNTGRDRMADISWVMIVIGVGTFLYAVYRFVRAWSRRMLDMASEKVMDVPLDGDDEDEG